MSSVKKFEILAPYKTGNVESGDVTADKVVINGAGDVAARLDAADKAAQQGIDDAAAAVVTASDQLSAFKASVESTVESLSNVDNDTVDALKAFQNVLDQDGGETLQNVLTSTGDLTQMLRGIEATLGTGDAGTDGADVDLDWGADSQFKGMSFKEAVLHCAASITNLRNDSDAADAKLGVRIDDLTAATTAAATAATSDRQAIRDEALEYAKAADTASSNCANKAAGDLASARSELEASISSNAKAAEEALSKVSNENNAAHNDLDAKITDNANRIMSNVSAIDETNSKLDEADARLQKKVKDEVEAAAIKAGDVSAGLDAKIVQEIADRKAEVKRVDDAAAAHDASSKARMDQADANLNAVNADLSGKIATNKENNNNLDSSLKALSNKVNTNAQTCSDNDGALDTKISDVSTALTAAITKERTDREDADGRAEHDTDQKIGSLRAEHRGLIDSLTTHAEANTDASNKNSSDLKEHKSAFNSAIEAASQARASVRDNAANALVASDKSHSDARAALEKKVDDNMSSVSQTFSDKDKAQATFRNDVASNFGDVRNSISVMGNDHANFVKGLMADTASRNVSLSFSFESSDSDTKSVPASFHRGKADWQGSTQMTCHVVRDGVYTNDLVGIQIKGDAITVVGRKEKGLSAVIALTYCGDMPDPSKMEAPKDDGGHDGHGGHGEGGDAHLPLMEAMAIEQMGLTIKGENEVRFPIPWESRNMISSDGSMPAAGTKVVVTYADGSGTGDYVLAEIEGRIAIKKA